MLLIAFSVGWEISLHCICFKREDVPYFIFLWMGEALAFCVGGENLPNGFLHEQKRSRLHLLKEEESPHYIFFTREGSGPLYFR